MRCFLQTAALHQRADNGFQQPIRSIAHALVIIGYKQLYRWLTLLSTSGKADPRSKALLQNALVRARMTELLGQKKLSPAEREGLFIVGIFSLLDVLLNVPMEQALEQLQLPAPVMAALARREGIYAFSCRYPWRARKRIRTR